jgi:F-type H+-transporting ATPase subunit b
MLIDWFTVGAQAINFLVLVWLLKRFLYQPVLRAIDAREKRIVDQLAAAERQKTEVQHSRDELQAKDKAFNDERGALLAKATLDAKAAGEKLLLNARQSAEFLTVQCNAALQSETAKLSHELARMAAAESIDIARAVLKDLAGAGLEEQIIATLAQRLRQLDPKAKATIGASLKLPDSGPIATSSFAWSDRGKATLQTALNETFSADIPLRFAVTSPGIAGIELDFAGQRLSWTIADYLQGLEAKVGALLTATPEGTAAAATVAPRPAAPMSDHAAPAAA